MHDREKWDLLNFPSTKQELDRVQSRKEVYQELAKIAINFLLFLNITKKTKVRVKNCV